MVSIRPTAAHLGGMAKTAELIHVNYPHHPGALYDCPACEARCHCGPGVADGTETECIWAGHEATS